MIQVNRIYLIFNRLVTKKFLVDTSEKKNNLILIKLKSSMKKMIKIAFVAAFAAIAGYGVYANQKSEVLSDLTLANVEALAGSGETTIECCLALWGTCKGDIKAPYVCASR